MMKQWLMRRDVRRPASRATHKLVGVQAALHQHLGAARANLLHRFGSGVMAVCRFYDLESLDTEPRFRRDLADACGGSDQQWNDELEARRFHRASQRHLVAGMHDSRYDRRKALRLRNQPFELIMPDIGRHRCAWGFRCRNCADRHGYFPPPGAACCCSTLPMAGAGALT
jgi:hypothetical protein